MSTAPGYDEAVRGWAAHLSGGGTTPWRDWLREYDAPRGRPATAATGSAPTPGAAELELVRRLALARGTAEPDPAFAELAGLALARTAPGRGPGRLPLCWPGSDDPAAGTPTVGTPAVGAPPVDPAALPVEELLRVGTGVLAELLLTRPPGPPAAPGRPPRRRPWSRAYRLAGAPVTVADLRAGLTAAGRVEGGRRPTVLIVAAPLDRQLAEVWSARVQAGAPVRWPGFVARYAGREELPPAADVARLAEQWARRVGPSRVHLFVAPAGQLPALRRTVGGLLGTRLPDPPRRGVPARLDPPATDLLRRLNRVLRVRTDGDRHQALLGALVPTLVVGRRGRTPPLPEQHVDWARRTGARVAEQLAEAGYAVHGDLGELARCRSSERAEPPPAAVLDRLTDVCLVLAAQRAAGTTSGREGRAR